MNYKCIAMEEKPKKQVSIELPEDVAQGCYSNLAIITHSSSEFVFDFIRMMPGIQKAKVQNRIIMTPEHAKRFFNALEDNLKKYEEHFGKISLSGKGMPNIPLHFGDGTPEA
ncbi:MAG: hypothetical protein BWX93_00327 [Bacteroidetes bacterium ADurb.Bin139]|nr:MAG: hypothetical protein BWX93_00327 [Bacteroidetes bacterium ADurb.Bin139]